MVRPAGRSSQTLTGTPLNEDGHKGFHACLAVMGGRLVNGGAHEIDR